ncbi:response regulator, partial [Klebsiella pneumoniae]
MEKYIYFICNKDVNIVLTDDYFFYYGLKQLTGLPLFHITYEGVVKESANKQVISSQADSLIKISRIWAD